jgi:hypothetical protein
MAFFFFMKSHCQDFALGAPIPGFYFRTVLDLLGYDGHGLKDTYWLIEAGNGVERTFSELAAEGK